MKNIPAIVFMVIILSSAVACKKSYTCTCQASIPERTENGIKNDAVDSTIVTTYSGKRSDADALCLQQKANQDSVVNLFNATVNCELSKK